MTLSKSNCIEHYRVYTGIKESRFVAWNFEIILPCPNTDVNPNSLRIFTEFLITSRKIKGYYLKKTTVFFRQFFIMCLTPLETMSYNQMMYLRKITINQAIYPRTKSCLQAVYRGKRMVYIIVLNCLVSCTLKAITYI